MKNQKRIFLFLLILMLLAAIYYFELPKLLALENIKQQKDVLLEFIKNYYWPSIIVYIFLYCLIAALSLPGAAPLSLLGGFLFGTLPGMLFILIGATSGAALAFLVVRYLVGSTLQKKYEAALITFNQEIKQSGAFYLLSLRLVPIFPFFLITILAALTTIPFKTFLITTFLGIIPGTFVFSFAGQQLQKINQLSDVLSFELIVAFSLLALFALVPIMYKKLKKKFK